MSSNIEQIKDPNEEAAKKPEVFFIDYIQSIKSKKTY